jgi:ankyrin repeat protein
MTQRARKTSSRDLIAALQVGDLQAISRALELGADPNTIDDRGWPMLFLALDQKSPSVVKILLDHGADPQALFQGVSAPLLATLRSDLSSLNLLIARGSNVNLPDPEGDVPLKAAAAKGDLAMAKALLDAGADIEYQGGLDDCSVLGSAIAAGNTKMIELLLDRGADPDRRDLMHQLPVDRLGDNTDPEYRASISQLLYRYSLKRRE